MNEERDWVLVILDVLGLVAAMFLFAGFVALCVIGFFQVFV